MNKVFKINFEFNQKHFYLNIYKQILNKQASYICIIDANVLTMCWKNIEYRKVINSSLINSCDGSSIAFFANLIYRKKYESLNGPDIFNRFIRDTSLKHVFIGNTIETINQIKLKMSNSGIQIQNVFHIPLPFLDVNNFDYDSISNDINKIKPDLIWVSLGAPKQEIFMHNILPKIEQGVMFGIGAAFNFYIGEVKLSSLKFFGLRFIWLNRLIAEPVKLTKRLVPYLLIIPFMLLEEFKIKYNARY
jgi:N-acetylglucosaminyldiphosphoundecaprenol N-acetyl-beta-D-mannosaminyltransferase